jgi:transposase
MAGDSRTLGTARIGNSPARLAAKIKRAGPHPKVVLEACYDRYWAADALAAAGAEVHLAHPHEVKAFACRRVKNDELDPRDLADQLRTGRLAEARIAPAEIRELREITRYRMLCRRRHSIRYRTRCHTGGLLWLCRSLDGAPVCRVLDATAEMTPKLTLGYRDAVAVPASWLADVSTRVTGHEFHRAVVHGAPAQPAWRSLGVPARH